MVRFIHSQTYREPPMRNYKPIEQKVLGFGWEFPNTPKPNRK